MGFLNFFRLQTRPGTEPAVLEEQASVPDELTHHHELEAARHAFNHAVVVLEIDAAIMAHEEWRDMLHNFIRQAGSDMLHPDQIGCDDRCDLGRWLRGEGAEFLGTYGVFADLQATHKLFHDTAAHIVSLHLQGQTAEAQRILDGHFQKLSHKILQRLEDMKAV